MKAAQWILLGLLVAIAAALVASWTLGLFDEPNAPAPSAAPTPTLTKKQPAPLDTAAWMLANSHRAQPTEAAPVRRDDDSACGPSGAPCPDDSTCIDGKCVTTACAPSDAGGGGSLACALPNHASGVCCSDRCFDLAADPAHCGRCDVACERGLDCISGQCEARSCAGQMAATSCLQSAGGRGACCRGQCADQSGWARDASNCGGCGHVCATGLACERGACVDPATGQPPSWNCFERGHTCPEDSFCVIDACYPRTCAGDSDGLLCPGSADGEIGHCCDHACTDLFTDKNNCRACGLRCGPGEACVSGECLGQH